MKIGILTFHYANNYGAVLQAYGLQEVLKSMGHQVEFVDYRNPLIEKRMDYFSLKNNSIIKVLYRLLFNYTSLSKRKKIFDSFRKDYLSISKRINSSDLSNTDYDLLIVGSDQIWNPRLTNGLDSVYWGEDAGDIPIITYAASSNDLSILPKETIKDICVKLEKFRALGVRETRLQQFLLDKCNKSSTVVLDPTLLAGKEIFERLVTKQIIKESYLLVYYVENQSDELRKIAFHIAKERNLKIVVLGESSKDNKKYWENASFILPTVPNFLSLIKHAECIVCMSFHGTAFSVMFEKDFYSVRGGNMARVETLLKPLKLEDRIISNVNELSCVLGINFKFIAELKNMQVTSKSFLSNCIGNNVNKRWLNI